MSFTGTAEATALAVASRGLTKRFGRNAAVDGIDLAIPRGSVYGFLGPNGSGKTTTIRMLLGLIRPSAGDHDLLGETMPGGAQAVLPRVGSLVEGPAFHPYLTGGANLQRLDAVSRTADPTTATARVSAALERVGLLSAAGKRYRAYSLGMRQRLAIAAALLSRGTADPRRADERSRPPGAPARCARSSWLGCGWGARDVLTPPTVQWSGCDHVGVIPRRLVAQAPLAQPRRDDTDRPAGD